MSYQLPVACIKSVGFKPFDAGYCGITAGAAAGAIFTASSFLGSTSENK